MTTTTAMTDTRCDRAPGDSSISVEPQKRTVFDLGMAHLASGGSRHDHQEVRCRRLLFRCWHRGTQEGDLILGRFAEAHLADFDVAQIERFEALLDCTDPDPFDWIVVGIAPPKEYQDDVMYLLPAFARYQKRKSTPRTITTIQE